MFVYINAKWARGSEDNTRYMCHGTLHTCIFLEIPELRKFDLQAARNWVLVCPRLLLYLLTKLSRPIAPGADPGSARRQA
jgi:hypothetical protein